jgi:mannose/cellobiose epimerase-like protein (N-acyl-D-glucosamine 2-epimerase family)
MGFWSSFHGPEMDHRSICYGFTTATGDQVYRHWYRRIWEYSRNHLINHLYGAGYLILMPDNRKYDDCKSPTVKTDCHTMGA